MNRTVHYTHRYAESAEQEALLRLTSLFLWEETGPARLALWSEFVKLGWLKLSMYWLALNTCRTRAVCETSTGAITTKGWEWRVGRRLITPRAHAQRGVK